MIKTIVSTVCDTIVGNSINFVAVLDKDSKRGNTMNLLLKTAFSVCLNSREKEHNFLEFHCDDDFDHNSGS